MPDDTATKTCRICQVDLPLTAFAKNNRRSDGYGSYCRPCARDKYHAPARERNRQIPPHNDGDQVCRTCHVRKPLAGFHWHSDKGCHSTQCKACARDRDRRYHEANPTRRRAAVILRKYGLTLDAYDALLAAQGGGCAICGTTDNPDQPNLAVDHDHATGAVRGILCGPCNKALGLMYDRTDLLRKAVAYLEK